MHRLIAVNSYSDIFSTYQQTPVSRLLEYQNLDRPFEVMANAQILVGMCIDNRKHLRIPENFAYIIRSGGANLRYSEFKVSFAIGVGRIQHIALISHNQCNMVNLNGKKDAFIEGLVEVAGWERQLAEDHFLQLAPMFEIGNEIDFTLSETQRLRKRYPGVMVAPLHYDIETNKISQIKEDLE